MTTCGRRAFGHAGPSTWNALTNSYNQHPLSVCL